MARRPCRARSLWGPLTSLRATSWRGRAMSNTRSPISPCRAAARATTGNIGGLNLTWDLGRAPPLFTENKSGGKKKNSRAPKPTPPPEKRRLPEAPNLFPRDNTQEVFFFGVPPHNEID